MTIDADLVNEIVGHLSSYASDLYQLSVDVGYAGIDEDSRRLRSRAHAVFGVIMRIRNHQVPEDNRAT
jgi:hypothetical protein